MYHSWRGLHPVATCPTAQPRPCLPAVATINQGWMQASQATKGWSGHICPQEPGWTRECGGLPMGGLWGALENLFLHPASYPPLAVNQ